MNTGWQGSTEGYKKEKKARGLHLLSLVSTLELLGLQLGLLVLTKYPTLKSKITRVAKTIIDLSVAVLIQKVSFGYKLR